ncbi:MAG: OsmC family protein [Verrucomicrobia bacterium]|nr:OsmC family protein [Verrucomicrobiota bacterium]
MSDHTARIVWERGDAVFTDQRYSRVHRWHFDGGAVVAGSPSPAVVCPPLSDPAAVDPEEAFVASLASCHMLWFLHFAAKEGVVVDAYSDEAAGLLGRAADGRMAMTRVLLRPKVRCSGARRPTSEDLQRLHHAAHEACFIANSVRTEVRVEPAPWE